MEMTDLAEIMKDAPIAGVDDVDDEIPHNLSRKLSDFSNGNFVGQNAFSADNCEDNCRDSELHRSVNGAWNISDVCGNPRSSCNTQCSVAAWEPKRISKGGDSALSDSLEDLVNSFDAKISSCFKNYTENTEEIAPVQVRTQEEIMNECQIWWTLTGNFGNILPIDWSKSYARKLHLPSLNLRQSQTSENELPLCEDESDDELAVALDMHSLIVASVPVGDPPPQTAEQVIEEIDELMHESSVSGFTGTSDITLESTDSGFPAYMPPVNGDLLSDTELEERVKETALLIKNEDNLYNLSHSKLLCLLSEMESLIQVYNETLVQELALKDDLEFEKELKNTFISILLNIQNKRRQYLIDKRRKGVNVALTGINGQPPQYVTAVLPYNSCSVLDNATLQILVKILRAISEDSPNVPALITDYILSVLCPTNSQ